MLALISIFSLVSIGVCSDSEMPSAKRPKLEDQFVTVQVSAGLSIEGYSAFGRVIEKYNFTEISRVYGEPFANALRNQTHLDELHDRFTSRGNDRNMSEMTHRGRIYLGEKISSSQESVLYAIRGHPHLLIKYQANCIEIDPDLQVSENHYVHPLVVDAIFAGAAASVGVGPKIHYLSPPGPLCRFAEGKCDFVMEEENFERCWDLDGASLRFMIIQKVKGVNLDEFKDQFDDGIVPLSSSLLIGLGIIDRLERLHRQAGVVHGDVHSQNIMLEHLNTNNGTVALKLIDYGRSFANVVRNNETVREPGWADHSQFSSWELEGYDSAARDDVEKAFQVIAQLMMPFSYTRAEKRLASAGSTAILLWKKFGNWFEEPRLRLDDGQPGGYDPVAMLTVPDIEKEKIRTNLKIFLELVRGMTHVNSIPPYSVLKEGFRITLAIVQEGERANEAITSHTK